MVMCNKSLFMMMCSS